MAFSSILALQASCADTSRRDADVRNLVVVCFDTVRADAFRAASLGGEGAPRARFRDRALRFDQAFAAAPWTVPSVASLLTGRDARGHRAGIFAEPVANLDAALPSAIAAEVPTLAERLAEVGFDTRALVAHPWFETGYGLNRGFASLEFDSRRQVLGAKAEEWLAERASGAKAKPFFLYLHFMDSHRYWSWPPLQKQRLAARLDAGEKERAIASAPGGACADPSSPSCTHYLAYVRSVASQLEVLAQMLGALEANGQLAETAVVLYSDHGEAIGDHTESEKARGRDPRGLYGFGHGQSLYDEQLHVPLWIWHPALPGREIHAAVSLLDVLPTLLEWLGVDPHQGALDGRSLAAELEAGDEPPADRALVATRIAYGTEQVAIRQGPWKRIRYGDSGEDGSELYHLPDDPRERAPRENAEVAAALDAEIDAWMAGAVSVSPGAPAVGAEQLEKLQALGYLDDVEVRGSGEAQPAR